MKKFLLAIAIIFPLTAIAQNEEGKKETKFEQFSSSIGSIVKFYDYKLPIIKARAQNVNQSVRKVIRENESSCFLNLSFTPYQRNEHSAFIYLEDLIELKKATEELKSLAEIDATGSANYLENKFRTSDGAYIGYYIDKNRDGDKEPVWYFNIDGYSYGTIFFKTADEIIAIFDGAIQKINEIK